MAITRWYPLRQLASMQREVERFFDEPLFQRLPFRLRMAEALQAQIDMYETDDRVVVKASLPGVKPEDIQVSVADHTLTIKGETRMEQEVKREQFHRQERRYGTFARSVTLPVYAETDKAEAGYENGVLTITMPKKEQAKAKSIKIKVQPMIEGKKAE